MSGLEPWPGALAWSSYSIGYDSRCRCVGSQVSFLCVRDNIHIARTGVMARPGQNLHALLSWTARTKRAQRCGDISPGRLQLHHLHATCTLLHARTPVDAGEMNATDAAHPTPCSMPALALAPSPSCAGLLRLRGEGGGTRGATVDPPVRNGTRDRTRAASAPALRWCCQSPGTAPEFPRWSPAPP